MEPSWKKVPLREGTTRLTAIDAHTAGCPLRLVTGGLPELSGSTILERQRCMQEQFDWVRQTALQEPRGHADMCGCVLTPASSQEADFGVLFPTATGYSPMSGHSLIAVVTILLETGIITAQARQAVVKLETPAGLVQATASLDPTGQVERVSFRIVPSFVFARDVAVEVKGVGRITLDLAFGGNFCAILPASQIGLRVLPEHASTFVTLAEHEELVIESILEAASTLTGQIVRRTQVGSYPCAGYIGHPYKKSERPVQNDRPSLLPGYHKEMLALKN